MLGSDVGSLLDKSTPYHEVAEGYGAVGLSLGEGASREQIKEVLLKAKVSGYKYTIRIIQ